MFLADFGVLEGFYTDTAEGLFNGSGLTGCRVHAETLHKQYGMDITLQWSILSCGSWLSGRCVCQIDLQNLADLLQPSTEYRILIYDPEVVVTLAETPIRSGSIVNFKVP